MGKGDARSKKGKIWRGSYGKTRLKTEKRKGGKQGAKPAAKG
jgi:ribosomal small subunit protein bTHX